MAVHELKINPDIYLAVASGKKTAEVRFNDRNYKVGDTLKFRPFDVVNGEYVGMHYCKREITHKQDGGKYGILPGCCMLSMK